MATDSTNELQQFCDFLAPQVAAGDSARSLDDDVQRFRDYQRQAAELRARLAVAKQQSAAGQSGPFDAEAAKASLRARLAQRESR